MKTTQHNIVCLSDSKSKKKTKRPHLPTPDQKHAALIARARPQGPLQRDKEQQQARYFSW
jgi:hypothetical protein